MPSKHGETQQKIARVIDTMDDDAEFYAAMFNHLQPKHPSVIRKAIKRLVDKGVLAEVREERNARGGKTKILKKSGCNTGILPCCPVIEGVFADLFMRPVAVQMGVRTINLLGNE